MLDKINRRLKEDGVRVQIDLRRGTKLVLRASLPDRFSDKTKQQRISLETLDVLEAEKDARFLGSLMARPHDLWERWDAREEPEAKYTFADFRSAARTLYETTNSTESAWRKKWQPALNKLPPDSVPVKDAHLLSVVNSMSINTATRRDQGNILAQIADSLKLNGQALRDAASGYTSSKVNERMIPKDEQIELLYAQIKDRRWRWMYGMCACYGLRPHEIMEAKIDSHGDCEVSENTKTGSRVVIPCHSRWVEEWKLTCIHRPTQTVETVTKAAADYLTRPRNRDRTGPALLPFPLYSLRHAYAVRLFQKQVPPHIGARLMGHSEAVHRRTYLRWYDKYAIKEMKHRFNF